MNKLIVIILLLEIVSTGSRRQTIFGDGGVSLTYYSRSESKDRKNRYDDHLIGQIDLAQKNYLENEWQNGKIIRVCVEVGMSENEFKERYQFRFDYEIGGIDNSISHIINSEQDSKSQKNLKFWCSLEGSSYLDPTNYECGRKDDFCNS